MLQERLLWGRTGWGIFLPSFSPEMVVPNTPLSKSSRFEISPLLRSARPRPQLSQTALEPSTNPSPRSPRGPRSDPGCFAPSSSGSPPAPTCPLGSLAPGNTHLATRGAARGWRSPPVPAAAAGAATATAAASLTTWPAGLRV